MWTVRLPNGRYSGRFSTHSDALKYARRMGGGTPVVLTPDNDPKGA